MHYYAFFNILLQNDLKRTFSFIAFISGTIYGSAKYVIATDLSPTNLYTNPVLESSSQAQEYWVLPWQQEISSVLLLHI